MKLGKVLREALRGFKSALKFCSAKDIIGKSREKNHREASKRHVMEMHGQSARKK